MNDDFNNWIAGFTDGEGSFKLSLYKTRDKLLPEFAITQRADAVSLLCRIRDVFGVGRISYFRNRGRVNPYVRLSIAGEANCLEVVKFFRLHPLQGKQRQVFELWAEVVEANVSHRSIDVGYCLKMFRSAREFPPEQKWDELQKATLPLLNSYAEEGRNSTRVRMSLAKHGHISPKRKVQPSTILGLIGASILLSELYRRVSCSRHVAYKWLMRLKKAGYITIGVDGRQRWITRTEKAFIDNPLDWS